MTGYTGKPVEGDWENLTTVPTETSGVSLIMQGAEIQGVLLDATRLASRSIGNAKRNAVALSNQFGFGGQVVVRSQDPAAYQHTLEDASTLFPPAPAAPAEGATE